MKLNYRFSLEYIRKGIKFYPVQKGDKCPAKINGVRVEWKDSLKLHQRLPTESECDLWFNTYDSDLAIITGKENNLVVVDCDDDLSIMLWENICKENSDYGVECLNTVKVKSRRGIHYYYKYPENMLGLKKIISRAKIFHKYIGIDLKGDGGCVKAPPSSYSNGSGIYHFLGDNTLKEFPIGFVNELLEKQKLESRRRFASECNFYKDHLKKNDNDLDRMLNYYVKMSGGRNERCFKFSCRLKDLGIDIDKAGIYIEKFVILVENKDHPFSIEEAFNCLNSGYQK